MRLVLDEARKHRAFREAWVGYILAAIYFLLCVYQNRVPIVPVNPAQNWQNWFLVQQDIYSYGATLTAFLLAIGLPRLVCYEKERRTDSLIGTAERGCRFTWRAKVIFTVFYCAAVVFLIGGCSLLANCAPFGFAGAFDPVESCVYFAQDALPPMSNLAYCMLQYVFLFLGALYFAGFVLLVAALTRRTAVTIFLSGIAYLLCAVYQYAGTLFPSKAYMVVGFFYRFGFGGYLLQESYSWTRYVGLLGDWADVWKPVLLVLVMIALEFAALWLLWRRKAKK